MRRFLLTFMFLLLPLVAFAQARKGDLDRSELELLARQCQRQQEAYNECVHEGREGCDKLPRCSEHLLKPPISEEEAERKAIAEERSEAMKLDMEALATKLEMLFNTTSLRDMAEFHSICYFCPLIVMLSEEVSFVFDIMHNKFRWMVLAFLSLFFAFSFLTTFIGRFKDLPFQVGDFSTYFKDMGGKAKAVLIAGVIAVVPPQTILSFTFEPIMSLTFAISEQVLTTYARPEGAEEEPSCDRKTIVDQINAQRRLAQDARVLPPLARRQVLESEAAKALESAREDKRQEAVPILSNEIIGGAVCLISNMVASNARHLVIGQVLLSNSWNVIRFKWQTPLVFLMGLLVFGLFFTINLFIVFYVLDALVDILLLAIKWPFMVVGYAFDVAKLKLGAFTDIAKKFGLTVVTLSVFTMFNTLLIRGFEFTVGKDKMNAGDVLNKALETGDKNLILDTMTTDTLGMTKFLFIVFAIFFVYAHLEKFAKQFGGQVSEGHLKKKFQTLADSTVKKVMGVQLKTDKDGNPETTYVKRKKR